jgi:DNA recombination protein RmuC
MELIMLLAILAVACGLALGAAVGYLYADRRGRGGEAALQAQLAQVQTDRAVLAQRLQGTEQNLLEQKKLLDEAQVKLRDAFAAVSADALAKNNEKFLQLARESFAVLSKEASGSLDQRKAQIEGLLKPMQELLGHYQSRLGDIEKSRVESYSMLREQLGTLAETQRTLNTQTGQLVTALSRPATRGQWGEISLRRLVEIAGMSSRCDFIEQQSVEGEDGRLRPDMVVRLPGDREVIIDCKASLDAFLDAAAAPDDDGRKSCLQRHAQQVRNRCRELSQKQYWAQFKRSPEYVVMFLPGEAFLYAAVEQDGSIIEDGLKNRVIVSTPTTLIALLKAIEFGWRQEVITENAEQIRKLGRDLYDRIATVAAHFEKLGKAIDGTVGAYNQAVGSLESRVLVTARKISELGANSGKDMPELDAVDSRPRDLMAIGEAQ